MNTLKYKDFIVSIRYSEEDEVFVGKIEGINSVVSFEGESVSELKEAFAEAAEDYLDFCKRKGIEPQKSVINLLTLSVGRIILIFSRFACNVTIF